jgi:hypothetical protein
MPSSLCTSWTGSCAGSSQHPAPCSPAHVQAPALPTPWNVGIQAHLKCHPTYVHCHLMDGDLPHSMDHMRNVVSACHHQWEMCGPEITATITAKVCTYWDMQNMEEDKVRPQQEKQLHVLAKATPSCPPARPALLHTHFQHNLLLSYSTTLCPSCTAPSPAGQIPDAASFLSTAYRNMLGQQTQNGQNLVIEAVFKSLC